MPKNAIHHLHGTAAAPIDFIIKLTYEDYVYFNQKAGAFKVTKNKDQVPEGFIQANTLRNHWSSAKEFDEYVKSLILLNAPDV